MTAARYVPTTQDRFSFGIWTARGAFWVVDALLAGGYNGPALEHLCGVR